MKVFVVMQRYGRGADALAAFSTEEHAWAFAQEQYRLDAEVGMTAFRYDVRVLELDIHREVE